MDFYLHLSQTIITRAEKIKLLIMDVDGTLTDGWIYYGPDAEKTKAFSALDGFGIKLLQQHNISTAIISGRDDNCARLRANDLNIQYYFPGCRDKKNAFNELLARTSLQSHECAYIGDDVIDLPIMCRVGLAVAVQNAHPSVKNHCHYVTTNSGGRGAVRELCDVILHAQHKLAPIMEQFIL